MSGVFYALHAIFRTGRVLEGSRSGELKCGSQFNMNTMEKLEAKSFDSELHSTVPLRKYNRSFSYRASVILITCAGLLAWSFGWFLKFNKAAPAVNGIDWKKCGDNIECGRLEVPLDYANPSLGNASLSLARYLATNKTARLGSLLANPGGPGGSGVNYIYRAGKRISDIVDGRYDVISWDPRGINGTTPRVECFTSETKQDIFLANTHQEILPDTRNLSDPIDYAAYTSGLRLADARNEVLAQLCTETSGETLKHVGTATVVRDLELIHRTLEGDDTPVNFWGFSYGTVVGAYFVNMFPDRVGRVAIDGVVNPDLWANAYAHTWLKDDFVDSEKALHNFYATCAKVGSNRCALASEGSTPMSISEDINRLLDKLYERPLPVVKSERPGALTQSMVKAYMFTFMYRPREWNILASSLSATLKGNGTAIMNAVLSNPELNTTKPAETSFSITAVTCVDTPGFENMTKEEAFEDIINEIVIADKQASHLFAPLQFDMCQHWTARETERFTGPFNHTLSNPILVIGNTADPITPVHNAEAVNKFMPHSSRLIIQDGSGHCSSAMASLCTARAIKEYFVEGKLPTNGLLCSTDENLFPASLSNESNNLYWLAESQEKYSEEDLALLETIRALGKELEPFVANFKKAGFR